ncbi:MAG: DUF4926 domain-containing protein [Desulfovibrio sp.]|nr:DUF4926 domain-containing protein [Desulfovibrio sp.]
MGAPKQARIEMFDVVRSTAPLEGYDEHDVLQKIPAGCEGTVVEVYGGDEAFEVDFELFTLPANPKSFRFVTLTVDANQCELVCMAPRNTEGHN